MVTKQRDIKIFMKIPDKVFSDPVSSTSGWESFDPEKQDPVFFNHALTGCEWC